MGIRARVLVLDRAARVGHETSGEGTRSGVVEVTVQIDVDFDRPAVDHELGVDLDGGARIGAEHRTVIDLELCRSCQVSEPVQGEIGGEDLDLGVPVARIDLETGDGDRLGDHDLIVAVLEDASHISRAGDADWTPVLLFMPTQVEFTAI